MVYLITVKILKSGIPKITLTVLKRNCLVLQCSYAFKRCRWNDKECRTITDYPDSLYPKSYSLKEPWVLSLGSRGRMFAVGRWSWVTFSAVASTNLYKSTSCACSRWGWELFRFFSLANHSAFLSPSFWKTARYRMKCCLKEPINPEQPTSLRSRNIWVYAVAFFIITGPEFKVRHNLSII